MHAIHVVDGLSLDPKRMRANVNATRGVILGEAVALALTPHLGKQAAHAIVERTCRQATSSAWP